MTKNLTDLELTSAVARYCASSGPDNMPPEAIERTKWVLLDELGCMLVGTTLPAGKFISAYAEQQGGRGACTALGMPTQMSTTFAALVNGVCGHADEVDGSHIAEGHPGASIISACMVAAEEAGRSGIDLLRAISLAYDVGVRLVQATGGRYHVLHSRHVHSDVLYTVGAAAGAGKLLGISEEQFRHSFVISSHQVNMPGAFFDEPDHITKALNCGQAAYAGVAGAVMARLGMTGNARIFEDRHGLLAMLGVHLEPERVYEGLGEEFTILKTNFKFFSAGYPVHAPLAAYLRLAENEGLSVEDVQSMEVYLTTNSASIITNRQMKSINLEDMLSVGMVLGGLEFEKAHNEANFELPEAKRLRDRIQVFSDPKLDARNPLGRGGWIKVITTDGRELTETQLQPPGHCELNDTTWSRLQEKFVKLASHAIDVKVAEQVAALIHDLDTVDDVRTLTRLLRRN